MKLRDLTGSPTARALFWAAALFAFVTLTLLGSFAYPATALVQLLIRLSLFGAAIEVVQAIPALHRDSDIWDWVADTLAIAFALIAVWWLRRPKA